MKWFLRLLILGAIIQPAYAGSIAVTPGAGTTVGAGTDGTNQIPATILCGAAASATLYATCTNQAIVNSSGQILTLASQSGAPWSFNLTQQAGLALAAPTAPGTPASSGLVPTVNIANAAGSGCPITNAGTSSTTACAIQGVTGGVPMPVSIGQSSGATIPISISTATTTQLIALSAGKSIYVTSWDVIAGGTGNITLEYGTGVNCGTGTTVLTGAYPLTAQTGIAKGDGLGTILLIPSGNALCALTSAAVQMSGSMSYTQQ